MQQARVRPGSLRRAQIVGFPRFTVAYHGAPASERPCGGPKPSQIGLTVLFRNNDDDGTNSRRRIIARLRDGNTGHYIGLGVPLSCIVR